MKKFNPRTPLFATAFLIWLGVTSAYAEGHTCGSDKCDHTKSEKAMSKCGGEEKRSMMTEKHDAEKKTMKAITKCGSGKCGGGE